MSAHPKKIDFKMHPELNHLIIGIQELRELAEKQENGQDFN